jgi:hypothetical protein
MPARRARCRCWCAGWKPSEPVSHLRCFAAASAGQSGHADVRGTTMTHQIASARLAPFRENILKKSCLSHRTAPRDIARTLETGVARPLAAFPARNPRKRETRLTAVPPSNEPVLRTWNGQKIPQMPARRAFPQRAFAANFAHAAASAEPLA